MAQSQDNALLISYAERYGNGAIFKRLGFLADVLLSDEAPAAACKQRITKGYALLDPSLRQNQLVTAWHLWVPDRWKRRHA